jgi:hypothetical protein
LWSNFPGPAFSTLGKKRTLTWQHFLLLQLLLALKRVITAEKLFDPHNPTIIMCDWALEEALQMKALHVSELR